MSDNKAMEKDYCVEKLVDLVRNHPMIYDTNSPDYRNIILIRSIWKKIAKAMDNPNMNGELWKKKWVSLRDTYIRRKREANSVDPESMCAVRKRMWRYYDKLSFLDETKDRCSRPSDMSVPGSLSPDQVYSNSLHSVDVNSSTHLSPCLADRPEHTSDLSIKTETQNSFEQNEMSGVSLKLSGVHSLNGLSSEASGAPAVNGLDLSIASRNTSQSRKRSHSSTATDDPEGDPDGDHLYLESCAKRMRKLSPQTRSFLKLQISQLFFNAENPGMHLPITPLPITSFSNTK